MQQNLLSGIALADRGSGTGLTTGTCSTVYVRALKPKPIVFGPQTALVYLWLSGNHRLGERGPGVGEVVGGGGGSREKRTIDLNPTAII